MHVAISARQTASAQRYERTYAGQLHDNVRQPRRSLTAAHVSRRTALANIRTRNYDTRTAALEISSPCRTRGAGKDPPQPMARALTHSSTVKGEQTKRIPVHTKRTVKN
jgi:hypothetical protein